AKRADVVAKVAPELPVLLGASYREAFLEYARARPMRGGYRRDALDFAGFLLDGKRTDLPRRELREWWLDRSGPAPRGRVARAARRVLPGRVRNTPPVRA
ncbi:endonuclease, partial [Streptomyces sp. SID6139]|nr:endonuclease [Streptomyces sp. SID6139]